GHCVSGVFEAACLKRRLHCTARCMPGLLHAWCGVLLGAALKNGRLKRTGAWGLKNSHDSITAVGEGFKGAVCAEIWAIWRVFGCVARFSPAPVVLKSGATGRGVCIAASPGARGLPLRVWGGLSGCRCQIRFPALRGF